MLQPHGLTMWKLLADGQSCVSGYGIWADGRASVSPSVQCRKHFRTHVQSLSSNAKLALWTLFQSSSARVPYLCFFVCLFFDLFVLPHTVLLSPQLPAPMVMVQHFSPHSCIKSSISSAKAVLEKAYSPCPLINIYFLWNSMAKLVYSW